MTTDDPKHAGPRDYGGGVLAAVLIAIGYIVTPSGAFFEWLVAAIALPVGFAYSFILRARVSWQDVAGIGAAGLLFVVLGVPVRMWATNNFTLVDALLLQRQEKFVSGFLLPAGYWLISAAIGGAIALAISAARHGRP
jgi:hypothetical protein